MPPSCSISTHSRAKAAGSGNVGYLYCDIRFQLTAARRRLGPPKCIPKYAQSISTHSRAKAAGYLGLSKQRFPFISTHSRAKAAGHATFSILDHKIISTHSRAKAAGSTGRRWLDGLTFQLTAARRRLVKKSITSRPSHHFNSQPREGGW